MNTMTKMAAGAVLGGSMLVAGGFGLANAAPDAPAVPQPQAPAPVTGESLNVGLTVDGQQVGTIQNVSLNTAQTLASSVCPSDDLSSKLPQLATNQIDTVPVCASGTTGVSYTFTTSGPGNSEIAPAQSSGHGSSGIGATATTTAPAPAEVPTTGSR
ncbi:hypothetical protein [Mycolicibacterium sphagni]|uniref:Uncharacterized protein n=1 Tax=Mycolicibacterium sphagni TaxID=1786 RepID=A0ABX2JNN1_9MYCO|nr:hypothetical protein [Mycolicibacterium sphagni]NTY58143.1 hypothetical protein [Mycolicibacterium sphagni]